MKLYFAVFFSNFLFNKITEFEAFGHNYMKMIEAPRQ